MNLTLLHYALYLLLAMIITVWVGRTLFTNGRTFLVDIFEEDEELADGINKLLLIGYYLINIGYATVFMKICHYPDSPRMLLEGLSEKIGTIMLILGVWHFVNLIGLYQWHAFHQNKTQKQAMM